MHLKCTVAYMQLKNYLVNKKGFVFFIDCQRYTVVGGVPLEMPEKKYAGLPSLYLEIPSFTE